jgi:hypothetical protein
VGDRAGKRAFALGSLNVNVDPLIIARAIREGIDARLPNSDPIRHAELAADVFAYFSNGEFAHPNLPFPRFR